MGDRRPKIIVGVDPGTTCGVAAITLFGKPIVAESKREMTKRDIIQKVIQLGNPVIVASDVVPAPEFVEKLAISLDANLFTPERVLETREKQELISDLYETEEFRATDIHAKDAMAAALKAFKSLKNKFEQAEAHILQSKAKVPIEEVFALIAKGRSIQEAVSVATPRPHPKPPIVREGIAKPEQRLDDIEVRALRSKIEEHKRISERLESENRSLRLQLAMVRSSLEKAERLASRLQSGKEVETRREREYQQLRNEILSLRNQISRYEKEIQEYRERHDSLKRLQELQSQGQAILLKPIESFTRENIETAVRRHQISPGDAVFLYDASGGGASTAHVLASKGVTCIVAGTTMAHQALDVLRALEIPVLKDIEVPIRWVEGYPFAMKADLEAAVTAQKSEETSQDRKVLDQIIRDYQRKRVH